MMIGSVSQIWRYPVKSFGGEALQEVGVVSGGIVGDRHWTVYDPVAPVIRNAKQWPELLSFAARYLREPLADDYSEQVAPVRIFAPRGQECESGSKSGIDAWLSDHLGRPAQLRPRAPAHDRLFYALPKARTEAAIAQELGLEAGEAPPDYSDYSDLAAVMEGHATPPGFLYDGYPVHVLTTDSLNFLAHSSGLNTDVRRFRPNLLLNLEQPNAQPTEQSWLGATLEVGEATLLIHSPTSRCSMPSRAQPYFGVEAERGLPRAMAQYVKRDLGVNAKVVKPGLVRAGDSVRIFY